MIRVFRHYVPLGTFVEIAADTAVYFLAFMLAVTTQKAMWSDPVVAHDIVIATCLALLMTLLNATFGLYRREQMSFASIVARSVTTTLLGCLAVYAVVLLILPRAFASLSAIRLTVPLALLGLVLLRRGLQAAQARGLGVRRVLVVGNGAEAAAVLSALQSGASRRYAATGLYPLSSIESTAMVAARTFSPTTGLWQIVREQRIDDVVVATRERRGGVLPIRDLLECRIHGVQVMDETGFYERLRGEFPIDSLKASWMIYAHGFEQGWGRCLVKRCFDLACAALLLTLAAPVMAITALLIKLESRGPAIYRQERVGHNGRFITCMKFRSMRVDAERDGVARWAQSGDSRITRIGRVIRMLRIDELPQLINVLSGEMSLVGPRPERPCFVDQLKLQIPFYDVRHSVKPGLTGWAQVRFTYASSLEETRRKLQFDLYYVKNHSLFLDLVILFETVRVVLFREGAK